jgi:hypothetical protein
MSQAGLIQQEGFPAAVLVATTDPPDGGRIAFHAGGHRIDWFPSGDGQHNAGMLDLEPSQVPGSGDRLEDREITGSDDEEARFPATHETTSDAGEGLNLQDTAARNFLHYLWPGPLATSN